MTDLKLAVEIGDLASEAAEKLKPINIGRTAERLVATHPESDMTKAQVAEVIREEQVAAVVSSKPDRGM